MFSAFKNFFSKNKKNIKTVTVLACVATVLVSTTILAFAATPQEIINALLNVLFDIAKWIGILLLAWGGIMLILAIRNEDADSKSRAVMLLVVAIALICLGTVFGSVIQVILPDYTPPA